MRKRIVAVFMAVVLCAGTLNISAAAEEAAVPDERTIAEQNDSDTEDFSVLEDEDTIQISDEQNSSADEGTAADEKLSADEQESVTEENFGDMDDSEGENNSESIAGTEDENDLEAIAGTEDENDPEAIAGTEGESDPEAIAGTEDGNESEATAGTENESDLETASGTENETDLETIAGSEDESEPEAMVDSEESEDGNVSENEGELEEKNSSENVLDEEELSSAPEQDSEKTLSVLSGKLERNAAVSQSVDEEAVASVGEQGYSTLQEAIDQASAGATITLLKSFEISETIAINKAITIEGSDQTITITASDNAVNPAIHVDTDGAVVLKNVTVSGAQRGIAIEPSVKSLTLEGVTLNVSERGITFNPGSFSGLEVVMDNSKILNSQVTDYDTEVTYNGGRAISIWNTTNSTVTLKNNSEISGFSYCINVTGDQDDSGVVDTQGLIVTVEDSMLRGWTGLNIWGASGEYNLVNAKVLGINTSDGTSNSFAALVFNGDIYGQSGGAHAENNVLNITDSVITNYQGGDCLEDLIRIDTGIAKLNLKGTVQLIDTTGNIASALNLNYMEDPLGFITNSVNTEGATIICTALGGELPFTPAYNAYYYWLSGGTEQGVYCSFEDIFGSKGYDLCDGEFIRLVDDVKLSKTVNAKLSEGSGSFTLTLDGHSLTSENNARIILAEGVSVITDTLVTDMFDVPDDYFLKMTDNGNGTYTYSPVSAADVTAEISGTLYESLQAAVTAAKAGDTIKMLSDEALGSGVVIDKNLILDLNGCSITRGTGNEKSWLLGVVSGAELAVRDSAGNGKIHSENYKSSDGNTYGGYGVLTNGALKVESGTVSGYYGVYVSGENASVTVEDGMVKGTNRGIYNFGGSIELTGGTVTSDAYGIFHIDGTASMKGGTVSGTTVGFIVSGESAKLTMEGGTIQDAPGKGIQVQSGGTLHVKSGTISSTNANAITAIDGSTVIIEGGTIKSDAGKGMVLQTGTQLTMTGGEVISATNAVELTSGIIDGENKYSSACISEDAVIKGGVVGVFVGNTSGNLKCTLEIEGGSIYGGSFAVSGNGTQDNTEITISGGTLSADSLGIYHPQVGDLTITGGMITAPNGIQYCGSGNLTIMGGTITATGPYSEFPTKPSDQGDGSTSDGAALALISRGGGYQSEGTSMNVTIGGSAVLVSENNAAVAVYRLEKVGESWVTNASTSLNNYLGELEITGGHLSGGSRKGAFEVDHAAKETVKVSGGYFSSDPTEYVVAGSAALGGKWIQSGETYFYTIGEIPDNLKIAEAPVKLTVDTAGSTEAADTALTDSFAAKSGSISHGSLTEEAAKLANEELSSEMDSLKTEGMEKLKNQGMLADEGQTMTLYLKPYIDIKVVDADAAANTLTLDMTVKYNLYASTASVPSDVDDTNSVILKEAEIMENFSSPIEITLPIPDGFKTVNLKVKHIKESADKEIHYYYTPEVTADDADNTVAVFTNPHGFSTFVLTADDRRATVEYQMADGTTQTVTYTAEDVGVTKLPSDSKEYHTFIGWKFPGDDGIYGPSELTDDLLSGLAAMGSVVVATPEFAAVTARIDITKKVLDSDGKAMVVDETFYASVFTDVGCTARYGEIMELKLQNNSEATAFAVVGVPEDGSSVSYYVAETDKNGQVVQSGEAFGWQVTISRSGVSVSDGETAEVNITNQKLERDEEPTPTPGEDEKPIPTPGEDEKPTPTPGDDEKPTPVPSSEPDDGGHKSSHSSSAEESQPSAVQSAASAETGDSTNILLPILLLLLGAAGIGGYVILWISGKKRKSDK